MALYYSLRWDLSRVCVFVAWIIPFAFSFIAYLLPFAKVAMLDRCASTTTPTVFVPPQVFDMEDKVNEIVDAMRIDFGTLVEQLLGPVFKLFWPYYLIGE